MSIFHRLACVLALAATAARVSAQDDTRVEWFPTTVDYISAAEAREGVRNNPDARFETQDGWTIARDTARRTVWAFVPKDDPAYPAVVRRIVVERNSQVRVDMHVLCDADKAICDDLRRQFRELNEDIARLMQQRRRAAASAASTR